MAYMTTFKPAQANFLARPAPSNLGNTYIDEVVTLPTANRDNGSYWVMSDNPKANAIGAASPPITVYSTNANRFLASTESNTSVSGITDPNAIIEVMGLLFFATPDQAPSWIFKRTATTSVYNIFLNKPDGKLDTKLIYDGNGGKRLLLLTSTKSISISNLLTDQWSIVD